jgi:uncharacterized membrane protein YccC
VKSGAERAEILHRSARVTLAASAGFYAFLYGLGEPVPALYALFGPISLGLLSPIPGSGRQRAAVMLKALPVGLVLVALGTVLAVRTWAAVLGMLVVGFVLAFAAIAGPRPAGAAPGLQLFYVLACFPPYEPHTLELRLAGLTVGVGLSALCELFVLPRPVGETYRWSLAKAVGVAGDTLAGRTSLSPETLRAAGARLRLSQIPPAERPAGPGRAVRGLSQAGSSARRLLEQLAHLTETGQLHDLLRDGGRPGAGDGGRADVRDGGPADVRDGEAPADAASQWLLPQAVSLCDDVAEALRVGLAAPGPQRMDDAIGAFQAMRVRQAAESAAESPPGPTVAPVLRRQAALLGVAESVRALEISVGVGLDGRRTPPIEPRELFWYTEATTFRLWLRRILGNMTPRSVQFHNAVRIALALGAARLIAGLLDLTHGFWVLLAVLTLSRTTVGETWAAVRGAVVGNLVGAVTAGALLIGLGQHTEAYAAILAPSMLLAFALGPLLGIAWAQGLFTLVVTTAFAQIAPTSWRLAEARIVDVVTGSAIGLLCAMLAWPAGARREVRRTMAGLLRECGPLVRDSRAAGLRPVPADTPRPAPDAPGRVRLPPVPQRAVRRYLRRRRLARRPHRGPPGPARCPLAAPLRPARKCPASGCRGTGPGRCPGGGRGHRSAGRPVRRGTAAAGRDATGTRPAARTAVAGTGRPRGVADEPDRPARPRGGRPARRDGRRGGRGDGRRFGWCVGGG